MNPQTDCHHEATVRMRGMGEKKLYPYQVFGIFVMFEMEVFQNGGYLADDMGLGKVISSTSRCIFTRMTDEGDRQSRLSGSSASTDCSL